MTIRFEWTEEQRAQCTPGATVCISGSPNHEAGRCTITGSGPRFVFLVRDGVGLSVPWDRCDPTTLNAPEQGDLFGGAK